MDKIELLRKEFQSYTFRSNLKMIKGNTCVNCGKDDIVEYHHIVPLILGETNNLDNIVPLCCECHDKAHTKYDDLKELGIRRSKLAGVEFGRKRTVVLNSETINILHKYFNNQIGLKEARTLIGLTNKTQTTWYRLVDTYKSKFVVPEGFKNLIDLHNSQEQRIATGKKTILNNKLKIFKV